MYDSYLQMDEIIENDEANSQPADNNPIDYIHDNDNGDNNDDAVQYIFYLQ